MSGREQIRALGAFAACLSADRPVEGLTQVRPDEKAVYRVLTADGRVVAEQLRQALLAAREEVDFDDLGAKNLLTVVAAALAGLDGAIADGEVAAAVADVLEAVSRRSILEVP